jgi:transposase
VRYEAGNPSLLLNIWGMKNVTDTTSPTTEDYQEQITKLEQQNAELMAKLSWYEEQFRLSQQKRFGASSEQTHPDQMSLFNEAEAESDPTLEEPTVETITYRRKKQKGQREAMLANLPVETIEYRLSEEEQSCSCCGHAMHEMSTETRQELKMIPAQMKVVKHVRYVYSCRQCDQQEENTPVVTAKMPKPVYPGSLASPSIMAYIMSQKYVESMPLYRQEQQFARLDIQLSRQTMANWMIHSAQTWLKPLYQLMHQHLCAQEVLHADETTLQVLREPGRAAQTTSYMWLFRTGYEGPPNILYEYRPTRGGEHPRNFLAGFKGYLHVDGYPGYHKVKDVTLVGCWSHARRGFTDVLKALPSSNQNTPSVAQEGLDFCNRLFVVERKIKNASTEERYNVRVKESRPILDAFSAWLRYQKPRVLPKSGLGKAINYCQNQWFKLEAFMLDGRRLELDNNRSERSIKPFVIGRKNFMFSNTPRGAESSAIIYSIIETAKENGLHPFKYLMYLFEQLPQLDEIKDLEALDPFLPWATTLPRDCHINNK